MGRKIRGDSIPIPEKLNVSWIVVFQGSDTPKGDSTRVPV